MEESVNLDESKEYTQNEQAEWNSFVANIDQ